MAFCNFFLKIPFVAVFYLNNSKKKLIVDQLLCFESLSICWMCVLRNEGCNLFVCLLKKELYSLKIRRLSFLKYCVSVTKCWILTHSLP